MRIHWANEPAVTIQIENTKGLELRKPKKIWNKRRKLKISLKEKIKGSRKNAQTLEILFKVRKRGTVYVKKKKLKLSTV